MFTFSLKSLNPFAAEPPKTSDPNLPILISALYQLWCGKEQPLFVIKEREGEPDLSPTGDLSITVLKEYVPEAKAEVPTFLTDKLPEKTPSGLSKLIVVSLLLNQRALSFKKIGVVGNTFVNQNVFEAFDTRADKSITVENLKDLTSGVDFTDVSNGAAIVIKTMKEAKDTDELDAILYVIICTPPTVIQKIIDQYLKDDLNKKFFEFIMAKKLQLEKAAFALESFRKYLFVPIAGVDPKNYAAKVVMALLTLNQATIFEGLASTITARIDEINSLAHLKKYISNHKEYKPEEKKQLLGILFQEQIAEAKTLDELQIVESELRESNMYAVLNVMSGKFNFSRYVFEEKSVSGTFFNLMEQLQKRCEKLKKPEQPLTVPSPIVAT